MKIKIPSGLVVLFMTEVWERFGFYIAQGLLALYMTQKFNFNDAISYSILGAFTGLAYIMPVLGGYLADKLLGYKTSILIGGFLLCIGYAILAFNQLITFYLALAIIVVGTGFLKPNISSLVGALYSANDPQREAGFTIFYVGIYLGVLLSTLISGFVHNKFGWSASFSLASLGIIFGLITFISGRSSLKNYGNKPTIPEIPFLRFLPPIVYMPSITLLMLISSWFIINFHQFASESFLLLGIILCTILFFVTVKYKAKQRQKLILLFVLFGFSSIFWALYFQTFFSLTLFIQRDVDRQFYGITIPTIVFLSVIPISIIIFGPIAAKMWAKLHMQKRDLTLMTKFGLGLIFIGLGFLAVAVSTIFLNHQGLVSPLWVLLSYLLITAGELFISPIGLSMITKLAPAKLEGMLMGCWFFSLGVGGQLAGVIAKWTSIPQELLGSVVDHASLYGHGFKFYALLGIISGIILLIANIIARYLFKDTAEIS